MPRRLALVTLLALAAPAPAQPRLDTHGDPLPSGALARLGSLRFGAPAPHFALRFTPDSKSLLHGCEPLLLRDLATGKELRRFHVVDRGFIRRFDVSPDGTLVCTVGSDCRIKLWDVATGKLRWEANAPTDHLADTVIFTPDGKAVISGCHNQTIRWWDVQTGKEVRCLHTNGQEVSDLLFSADAKTLVSAGRSSLARGKALCLWDVATGQQRWLEGHAKDLWNEGGVLGIALSRDGLLVASAGADGTARVWDVTTGKQLYRLELNDGVAAGVAFYPDGKRLVTLGSTTGRVWDLATGMELFRLAAPKSHFRCVTFSPDGKVLATGGQVVRLWDPATGKELNTGLGHRDEIMAVAALPRGEVLTAGWDHTIRRWDAHAGKELATFAVLPEVVTRLAVSPDGTRLATGEFKGAVRLWDLATGKELRRLDGLGHTVLSLLFPSDGTNCLAGGDRDTFCLWDADTGKVLRQIKAQGGHIWSNCWAVTPNAKAVARTTNFGSIQLWDLTTGKELPNLVGHTNQVSAAAFSPDGTRLVSADWSNNLILWDWTGGKSVWQRKAHSSTVTSLRFAPDGHTFGSASYDQTAAVWETATGNLRVQFGKHEDIALTMTFLDRGRTLVSAGRDCTALVWDVTGQQQAGGLQPAKLTAKDLEALWADLVGADAAKAHRAIWMLAAAPAEALPYVQKQLLTPALADGKRLAALLEDLGSPKAETATAAARELEVLGDLAAPFLREVLKGQPPAAVRGRVEALLKKAESGRPAPYRVRQLRALEVVEHIGTAEALQVLEALTSDRGDAFLGREAKAAMARAKRSGSE
jgi:WD40 repeat protein